MIVDPTKVRGLAPQALDDTGRLRVLPASFWAGTTIQERALFGHRYGLYGFPTVELVEHLRDIIGSRSAIEIGAGHGVLGEALGIPATDSRMQEQHPYRQVYEAMRQPIAPYGPNILAMDAATAVRRLRPQVVIGCWITHRFEAGRPDVGGNEVGVDEVDILERCETYVMIGHEGIHGEKRIWARPHVIAYPDFVVSRAHRVGRDFVAVFAGGRS